MAISKFQRSRLTFVLSARSFILESHQYIKTVFSEATRPIELIWRLPDLRGVNLKQILMVT